jgi:hypothetical protein
MFINVIQDMVIKNLEIAVCGSIIMNYIIMHSVKQNVPLPNNFCKWTYYLKHAFNWTIPCAKITNPHLWQAVINNATICVSNGLSAMEMPRKP